MLGNRSEAPLLRTYEIMGFVADFYGQQYAPNSRETFRRKTLHQFADELLVRKNPDEIRPTNSPNTYYQVEAEALSLARTYETDSYSRALADYLAERPGQINRHAAARLIERLPVSFGGRQLMLSPGGQNELIKQILEVFCPRFTPGAQIVYVGDADDKWVMNEIAFFESLGIDLDLHGAMPDVVAWMPDKQWLLLIEAVTSHGPVDTRRRLALRELFAPVLHQLVLLTCFPNRAVMRRFLSDIAWETEVWCADHPDHLIHFNGERFLGPYES